MIHLTIYLVIVNALSFLLMLADKYKARKKLWRIPESVLLAAALLGGSLGSIIGMYGIRHKTRHPKFVIGLPLLLILNIMTVCFLFRYL